MTDALMLVGGGVVGAGVALLLAPHSGRRTRREIARLGKTIGTKGDRAVRDVVRKANELADTVGEKVGAVVREGKDMVSEGKKELLAVVEKGEARLASRRSGMARDVS
jgi:gas vesicle protein